jgi:UDP-glucose 4-epimerase
MLPQRWASDMSPTSRNGPTVVTGGAGSIGSALVGSLLELDETVRVVDNLSGGRREQLPGGGKADRLELTVADLREPSSFESTFAGASSVWHLAANTDIRRGTADPKIDFEHGTLATYHVLEAIRRHDVPLLRYSSSSVVYGYAKVLPTPEEYGPLEPESLYGGAKLAAEGMCTAYAHTYGFRLHMFRFANIIGPGMYHGILPDFFEKLRRDPTRLEILGDGHQSKSYLRTEDCVAAMLLAVEKSTDRVNLFNLGTTDRITAREIGEKVIAAHGGRARIEYAGGDRGWVGDVPQTFLAIDRILRLGWKPRYTSAQAIDRTIEEMVEACRVRP